MNRLPFTTLLFLSFRYNRYLEAHMTNVKAQGHYSELIFIQNFSNNIGTVEGKSNEHIFIFQKLLLWIAFPKTNNL